MSRLGSNPNLISGRFNRDLLLLDLIENSNSLTDFGKELLSKDEATIKQLLKNKVLTLPKMKKIQEYIDKHPKTKSKDLISSFPSDFFDGEKESSKVIYATKAMTWLK